MKYFKKIFSITFLSLLVFFNSAEAQSFKTALQYFKTEQYKKAAIEFEAILPGTEKKYGKNDTNYYAKVLLYTAVSFQRSSNYYKAEQYYLQCNMLFENIDVLDKPVYGISLNNLGKLYFSKGLYYKAVPLFRKAIKNTEKAFGKMHSEYATALNNLALSYKTVGQYNKALSLFLEALEITEKTLGKKHPDYGIRLNNLAELYKALGQYEKALTYHLAALDNCKKYLGKEHASYGNRLNNLAELYRITGQYEKALPLYLEALKNKKKTTGKGHYEYNTVLNNLALLYEAEKQCDKAVSLYSEVLKYTEKTVGKEHSEYNTSLNNLAVLYYKTGQFEKALPLFKEVVKNTKKVFGTEHILYGKRLNNLSALYLSLKQYEKALPLLNEAVNNISRNINKNFVFLSEKEKEDYLKTVNYNFNYYNSCALYYKKDNSITETVFNNTLKNKGILLKSSVAMRSAILNSKDKKLINLYDEWTLLNKQIVQLYSTEKSKRNQNPGEIEEKATVIERELVKKSQEFNNFNRTQDISWKDIQRSLKSSEAVVEFINFRFFDKAWTDTIIYCALILKSDGKRPEMINLFKERELQTFFKSDNQFERIEKLYGNRHHQYGKKDKTTADSLYKLIWSKIDTHLKNIKTVYYSPSGLLHKVSFAAIQYNDSLFLSDKYNLIYLASTENILIPENDLKLKESNVTIYGGLYYNTDTATIKTNARHYKKYYGDYDSYMKLLVPEDSIRGNSWSYLPGTLTEAENINKMFKKNNIKTLFFSGDEGIEESFKALTGNNSPDIIHFATHGFFFPGKKKEYKDIESSDNEKIFQISDNPLMRSGLIMSGADHVWTNNLFTEGTEDGILTAYEVSCLDLFHTKLVVLSACETGLGEIKGSEGVYGLQRSFKMAGVNNLIMSLWQIPDNETSEFMQLFYKKLIGGEKIGEAFRETQNYMKTKYDPFYWAAFVLIE